MTVMLSATFDTPRKAEMTIERLVQQFDFDRAAIFVATESDRNSVGTTTSGSDAEVGEPDLENRSGAPLNGGVVVTVEVPDEQTAETVRDAFGEFDAAGVVETDPVADPADR